MQFTESHEERQWSWAAAAHAHEAWSATGGAFSRAETAMRTRATASHARFEPVRRRSWRERARAVVARRRRVDAGSDATSEALETWIGPEVETR